MIYDPTMLVLGQNSFDVARDSLENLYDYNQMILDIHF